MNNLYQAPKANLEVPQSALGGTNPSYTFQLGEDEIVCELQLITGWEKVYLNGKLLSSKWNLRRKGVHTLHVDGEEYQLVVMAESLIKPIRSCWLEKEGVVLKKYRSESKPKGMYFWFFLLAVFVEAVVVEILAGILGFYLWGTAGSLAFLFVAFVWVTYLSNKHGSVEVLEVGGASGVI